MKTGMAEDEGKMTMGTDERFARLKLLLGAEGLERLGSAHVLVIGVGGVGSNCAEALARGGVGEISIIDGDVVEPSNINRQALAFTATLGMDKVEAMARMIREINPVCTIRARKRFLMPDTVDEALSAFPRPDYVIDCIDTVGAKLAVIEWCADQAIPMLSAMGAANKLDPMQLRFADIAETTNCRLSRVIRQLCRRRGLRRLEVIYSTESPVVIAHTGVGKADTLGSMSYMPPIMGQMLAGRVLRRLAGLERGGHAPERVCPPEAVGEGR